MNIRFTDEMNSLRAARVIGVLSEPRLWIPTQADYGEDHVRWLEKAEQEIVDGSRHAVLAQIDNRSVGAVVFRRDPTDPRIVDIRNISINPKAKGRYFGAFMMRQVECLTSEYYPDTTTLRVDTKTTNQAMLAFFARQGYHTEAVADLYDSGRPDVVLVKNIDMVA